MTRNELIRVIVERSNNRLRRSEVAFMIDALGPIAAAELRSTGSFTVPGVAKLVLARRAPTKARTIPSPQTGEPIRVPAKPATTVVRAKPVASIKSVAPKRAVAAKRRTR